MNKLKLAPENLEVANIYLSTLDVEATANALDISQVKVTEILKEKEVKTFLDTVCQEVGYRNKHKLGKLMDDLIDKKLEELEDADISSSKDITELLALQHKMTIENKRLDIELIKAQNAGPSTQINLQTNNYDSLVDRILKA